MSSLGVTPDIINNALTQTNFVKWGGYLSDYKTLYLAVTDATITTKQQLEDMIVSNDHKRIIQLKDIADVQINEGIEYTRINANGDDGVLIAVIKQHNANLVSLSDAMADKVNELKKILPADVTIKPYYIQADFVN